MPPTIRTRRLIQVFAPRRSGQHAIMWWILAQLNPPTRRCNNRRLPWVLGRVKWYDYEACPLLGTVMANYEDTPPEQLHRLLNSGDRQAVVGLEADITQYVVILRDPFNNLASKRRANPDRDLAACRPAVDQWKAIAREYLGITRYLPGMVAISYNRWFQDKAYRLALSEKLSLDFDDNHPDAQRALVAVPGRLGTSQFDGRSYDGHAQQMDILNRWRTRLDDPIYLELCRDQEMLDLSRRIFGMEDVAAAVAKAS